VTLTFGVSEWEFQGVESVGTSSKGHSMMSASSTCSRCGAGRATMAQRRQAGGAMVLGNQF
jgi:hypothetical protein